MGILGSGQGSSSFLGNTVVLYCMYRIRSMMVIASLFGELLGGNSARNMNCLLCFFLLYSFSMSFSWGKLPWSKIWYVACRSRTSARDIQGFVKELFYS